jgi:O-antigen ligase
MILSRFASWLLLVTVALAPWLAGARARFSGVLWILGTAMVSAFLLVAIERTQQRRWLRVPRLAVWTVVFLLGCLGLWSMQQEPLFATSFAAEHWAFLEHKFPAALLQWPRAERLFFLAALLLGFLATVDVGREPAFRKRLCLTMGVSGVFVALYGLGQRWLGIGFPPWLQIAGDYEHFNACFFHHGGPSACLNFAWPLLVFRAWRTDTIKGSLIAAVLLLPVVVLALPLWHSQTPWAVAAGLLMGGFSWLWLAHSRELAPTFVLGAVVALFLAVFTWQAFSIRQIEARYPDYWMSSEATAMDSATRDARFRAQVQLRGDHMIISSAPPRPAAWLTALRMASDHPLMGHGPGSWVYESSLYSNDPIVNTFYQHRQFAHHDLLQTAAEWGGLAAVAWLLLWVGGIYRAAKHSLTDRPDDMGLILALVAVALHSLVHFPLQIPALQIWTTLALGLAWSRSLRKVAAGEPKARA